MRSYDCYLFDADGTLIDTADMIFRCFLRTCRIHGGFDVSRDLVLRHVGRPLRTQLEVYLGPLSDEKAGEISATHMDYQLSIYREELKPFPGVNEGLAALKACGKRCAVVTSRRMQTLELYLRFCGLWDFFEVFVTPESTDKHKPDPQPALKALELLAATPAQALFVGDAVWDIECGRSAGMDTALVAWSENDSTTLLHQPTYIIKDLRDLTQGKI
jgi:pyrophosphatase PpaX